MRMLLGNKTLVLISITVSGIGPNLVSEYMNLRMVEFSRLCVLLYAVYYLSGGLQKLKITTIYILFNCSHIKGKKNNEKCRMSLLHDGAVVSSQLQVMFIGFLETA